MKRFVVVVAILAAISATGFGVYLYIKPVVNDLSQKEIDSPKLPSPQELFVDERLSLMTLRQKIASLLILHTPGTDVININKFLQDYEPGGLILMRDNIPNNLDDLAVNINLIQVNDKLPYFIAIDQEGGVVRRIYEDNYPSAFELKSLTASETKTAFRNRSQILKDVGINLNFGIVADVTSAPRSFIYQRVFGGDPIAVSDHISAAVDGSKGLTLSTLKHFPGHGETLADSHNSIPTTDVSYQQWQSRDEPPFKSGIKSGAQFVMFGHLIYSSVDTSPASLSAKWHQILHDQDEFSGISITDDMNMLQQSGDINYFDPITNVVSAINAGNTMLLYVLGVGSVDPTYLIDGIVAAVNNGAIDKGIIDDNARQVLLLRHSLAN